MSQTTVCQSACLKAFASLLCRDKIRKRHFLHHLSLQLYLTPKESVLFSKTMLETLYLFVCFGSGGVAAHAP